MLMTVWTVRRYGAGDVQLPSGPRRHQSGKSLQVLPRIDYGPTPNQHPGWEVSLGPFPCQDVHDGSHTVTAPTPTNRL